MKRNMFYKKKLKFMKGFQNPFPKSMKRFEIRFKKKIKIYEMDFKIRFRKV